MNSSMNRLLRFTVAFAALTSFSSCFPKAGLAPGPLNASSVEKAQVKYPGMTAEKLEAGRGLFLKGCNGCHSYPDLASVPEAKWPSIMKEMGKEADFTPEQTETVLQFVLTTREG